MNIKRLIEFIESHGNKVVRVEFDRITAINVYCYEGEAYLIPESFPATLQAARDWLGY